MTCPKITQPFSSWAEYLVLSAGGTIPVAPPVDPDPDERITIVLDNTCATDVSDELMVYLEKGGRYTIPEGCYLIKKPMLMHMHDTIDVKAHGAIFYGGEANDKLDGTMFIFDVSPGAVSVSDYDFDFTWEGGRFDTTNILNSQVIPYSNLWPSGNLGQSNVSDAIGFRGFDGDPEEAVLGRLDISQVTFYAGDHWQTAGGDSLFGAAGFKEMEVYDNTFIGARDLGVYLSGGPTEAAGENMHIHDNKFINCFGAVGLKRHPVGFIVEDNEYENCVFGTGIAVLTDIGRDGVIRNNTGKSVGVMTRMDDSDNILVYNNINVDAGWTLEDGSAPNQYANHTGGRFIDPIMVLADGTNGCTITNNQAIGVNPAYPSGAVSVGLLEINGASNTTSGNAP